MAEQQTDYYYGPLGGLNRIAIYRKGLKGGVSGGNPKPNKVLEHMKAHPVFLKDALLDAYLETCPECGHFKGCDNNAVRTVGNRHTGDPFMAAHNPHSSGIARSIEPMPRRRIEWTDA